MLFQREHDSDESEDEMQMEHRQIQCDLKDSYVDYTAYEQYRKNKQKGFFSKIGTKSSNKHHNNNHDFYYQNEGLFVIDEEP